MRAAIANLFGAFGSEYQGVLTQFEAFHNEFDRGPRETIASTNYAVLLPTADIVTSMVTSLPAYNAALFTQQPAQGDPISAIGLPIGADVGLATVAGAVEFLVVTEAVVNTLKMFSH